jgi:hypothetical protein
METWQHKAAFVIQFRPGTDIAAGQFEGRIEHIASTRARRFHSLNELVTFMASILSEISDAEET